MDLGKVAEEIQHRIIHIFARDPDGTRATNGGNRRLDRDTNFRDYVFFHEVGASRSVQQTKPDSSVEFFHGNSGQGLGASHQTGW